MLDDTDLDVSLTVEDTLSYLAKRSFANAPQQVEVEEVDLSVEVDRLRLEGRGGDQPTYLRFTARRTHDDYWRPTLSRDDGGNRDDTGSEGRGRMRGGDVTLPFAGSQSWGRGWRTRPRREKRSRALELDCTTGVERGRPHNVGAET